VSTDLACPTRTIDELDIHQVLLEDPPLVTNVEWGAEVFRHVADSHRATGGHSRREKRGEKKRKGKISRGNPKKEEKKGEIKDQLIKKMIKK